LRTGKFQKNRSAIDFHFPASYPQAMTKPIIDPEQAEELDRRIDAYERKPSAGTPWEQLKAGLPKRQAQSESRGKLV
jgi:Putative addiction module component